MVICMLEGSHFLHALWIAANWCSVQFQNSRIIQWFLQKDDKKAIVRNSIFFRIFWGIRRALSKIFYKLGLNKLFVNSIFKMSCIWCSFAVLLAPILPTMLVLAFVLAGFGSLFLSFLFDRKRKMKYFSVNRYIYFYAFIYLFATLTSVTRKASFLGGILTVCFILFSIVLSNAIETKKQFNVIVFFFICIGVLVSFYGFYQYLFPSKFSGVWHDVGMFETINFRVYSTLENPNVLGEYFLIVIPFSAAFCINSKSWFNRLFFAACSGIMMVCLVLTYSRGCYIGIIAAAVVFLVLWDRRFIFLGIGVLILLPFILPETIINRFLSIGNMADSSTSYRVYIWLGTIAMLKDYWLCGIGPGMEAFNRVYPLYAYNSISAPHSHNLFLQIVCDTGIVGLIVFVLLIFQYYRMTCGALSRENKKENKVLLIAAISSVTGFMVQSMSDYTFYNYRVMLLFWVCIGFGMVLTKLYRLKEE